MKRQKKVVGFEVLLCVIPYRCMKSYRRFGRIAMSLSSV